VEGRGHHQVLDGECGDNTVVRLEYGAAEDVCFGVEEAGGKADLSEVEVAIDNFVNEGVWVLIEIDEADFDATVFGGDTVVEEVLVGVPGAVPGGVGDDDRAAIALAEVVEDAANRVDVGGTELVVDGDSIGLEEHVFLALKGGTNLIVDGEESAIDIPAAVFTPDERDSGSALKRGDLRAEVWGSSSQREKSSTGDGDHAGELITMGRGWRRGSGNQGIRFFLRYAKGVIPV